MQSLLWDKLAHLKKPEIWHADLPLLCTNYSPFTISLLRYYFKPTIVFFSISSYFSAVGKSIGAAHETILRPLICRGQVLLSLGLEEP